MLDDGALAVSLPALELAAFRPPGSIFSADDFAAAEFSPALSLAVDLVTGICRESGFEPTFVARPEIFTHGESRAWLAKRLGGVKDHLALSDGTTIRLIPGLRNHVFLFGLGRTADGEALQRLERRAPELFGSLRSQVNTALQFGKRRETPAPLAIAGVDALAPEAPQFMRVAINADSVEDSFGRTLKTGALVRPARRFSQLEYVALTETSLNDRGFAKAIAEKLNHVYFDAHRGLILRAPPNAGASSKVEDRIRAVVAALVSARARVPLGGRRQRAAGDAATSPPTGSPASPTSRISLLTTASISGVIRPNPTAPSAASRCMRGRGASTPRALPRSSKR